MARIYVSPERVCFLETQHKGWEGPRVKFLRRGEALRYADLYHIEGLRELLSWLPAVAGPDDIVTGLTKFRAELTRGNRDGSSELEVVRMVQAIDSVCQTEGAKVSKSRWANHFTQGTEMPHESDGRALHQSGQKPTVAR